MGEEIIGIPEHIDSIPVGVEVRVFRPSLLCVAYAPLLLYYEKKA